LLEMPGLQGTPALTELAFAYQAEIKEKREVAKATAGKISGQENMFAMDRQPSAREKTPSDASMQTEAASNAPKPLNVIQKTFRAEALARLQRALAADCGFGERLVTF
jgi:hypothetical protein